MKIRYIFLGLVLCIPLIFSMKKPAANSPTTTRDSANAIILIDNSITNIFDIIPYFVAQTIDAKIPLILSSHIIRLITSFDPALLEQEARASNLPPEILHAHLVEIYRYQKTFQDTLQDISDPRAWTIFLNTQKDWAVCIPASYKEPLSEIGLNKDNLTLIAPEKLKETFATVALPTDANISRLTHLFDTHSSVRKQLILIGHGQGEKAGQPATVASLNRASYQQLLAFLNPFTDLLFIISCYAGGQNMLMFNQSTTTSLEQVFNIADITFPIILSTSTDTTTAHFDSLALENFFPHINAFLKTGEKKELKAALGKFYDQTISNIPSIRFPGTHSFFRPIELDSLYQIITQTTLKKHQLASALKNKALEPLIIDDKKAILIHPAVIDIPLTIRARPVFNFIKTPTFISQIAGPACHIIDTLNAPQFTIHDVLKMFCDVSSHYKSYVIRNLVTKEGTFHNFMTLSQAGTFIEGIGRHNNEWVIFAADASQTPLETKKAAATIAAIIHRSLPSAQAVYHATGGQQTLEILEAALKDFIANAQRQ